MPAFSRFSLSDWICVVLPQASPPSKQTKTPVPAGRGAGVEPRSREQHVSFTPLSLAGNTVTFRFAPST